MDTVIKICFKNVYGVNKAYPANPQANRLAELVGSKTLTEDTLKAAENMGFTVEEINLPQRVAA